MICSSSSSSSSSSDSSDRSSEEEFTNPCTPILSHVSGVRTNPDFVGRRVRVSETYFKMNEDSFFGIRVYKWCRYRNYEGKHTYGYEIHYDEGDKYYIIESNI